MAFSVWGSTALKATKGAGMEHIKRRFRKGDRVRSVSRTKRAVETGDSGVALRRADSAASSLEIAPNLDRPPEISGPSEMPWEVWQKGRASFNHDWLKNHYLLALDTFLNVLDDLVENQGLIERYVSSLLPEWEIKRPEITRLLNEFAVCMSPRSLFSIRPLSDCPLRDREYFGALVDSLWRERHPVERWALNVRTAIESVEMAYCDLRKELALIPDTTSLLGLRDSRSSFAIFRRVCCQLARAVEALPGTLELL